MGNVVIYTKTGCPYCQKALQDYRLKGIDLQEVNTSEDPVAKQMIKERYGAAKVPVIIEDGKVVSVGYNGGG